MSRIVENPNLPNSKVKAAIAGNLPEPCLKRLEKLGIKVLNITENPLLSAPVASHADLQFLHIKNNETFIFEQQIELKKTLEALGFNIQTVSNPARREYPFECALNIALVGNNALMNEKAVANETKQKLCENGYNIIDIKQGYSRCSTCIVNENAVITEDLSVKRACESNKIDVLLIRKGFVLLNGYDYGFIGGASFRIDKNTVAFIGNIEEHPDFFNINKFLNEHNANFINVFNGQLTDVGGVLPIIEE